MWLFDNPLGNLRGPEFLVLYALVILVTLIAVWVRRRAFDTSLEAGRPQIPREPDPMEIAVLRGGRHELTRVVVATLVDRGDLVVTRESGLLKGRKASVKPGEGSGRIDRPEVERLALEYFEQKHDAADIFKTGGLSDRLMKISFDCEEKLRNRGLLTGTNARQASFKLGLIGTGVIFGFGAYKFAAAMHHGRHNVGFLILEGIVGLLLLIPAARCPRITALGRVYLQRIQTAFGSLKTASSSADVEGRSRDVALAAALFGVTALQCAASDDLTFIFQRAAQQADSGAVVSSCGGGTSCGGGGGGCGGGGCGGCGGG